MVRKEPDLLDKPTDLEPPPASSEPSILLETEGLIDNAVCRGVAKTAFNYLAKMQGAAYVLDQKFDYIREFIIGKVEDRALVQFSRRPILADDTPQFKRQQIHLIIFERLQYGLRGA